MNQKQIIKAIRENVIQGKVEKEDEGFDESLAGRPGIKELIEKAIEMEVNPKEVVNKALSSGMKVVGERFGSGEYFVPDVLASAEAFGIAMDILEPKLVTTGLKPKAKFILATVEGDIHDIGKNMVAMMLKGNGFKVKDLGVDVSSDKILEVLKKEKPQFLGLSALLTTTMKAMSGVIKRLEESGLRSEVKVLIGGAPVSEEFAKEIGADGYGEDAFQAVRIAERLCKR